MILPALFPLGSKQTAPDGGRGSKGRSLMLTKGFSEKVAVIAGIAALMLTVSADAAGARGRTAGAQRTHHTEGQRTANGRTRHDDWTNAQGKTATRDATVVNDRANGTRTRDVDWQGPNGKSATREDVTQRTADGYTRDSTFTGPNGKTATRDATVVRDKEAGTTSRDVVTTGPNGRTRTVNDDIQRTADGYTRETVRTNANGGTTTRDVNAIYDSATKTFTKDVNVEHEHATP
jgi:hypothetical protein